MTSRERVELCVASLTTRALCYWTGLSANLLTQVQGNSNLELKLTERLHIGRNPLPTPGLMVVLSWPLKP